ncbi:helix-turn-helix domain-containing protein [Sphingobium sp. KCTC 72723]|uniref:helix-turn-helix domain-containing protein n=1 Tax=Sphingobium sp. KCTC 72723 TaxID=2733867 RepID=UPI00165E079B|nr:helix-turn-helix transcriptional regulator [Sphingobium sp. KCTC 72723]
MTEEFPTYQAFHDQALSEPYSEHVELVGLDQLRAHQRGEKVGKPVRVVTKKKRPEKPATPPKPRKKPVAHTRSPRRRVTMEMVDIVKASSAALSQDKIAKQLGIAQSTVGKILNGEYD